jgi:VacB/RNase II family 3'-5' exoribonuclease
MAASPNEREKSVLERIAWRVMRERGFEPDFPPAVLEEVGKMQEPRPGATTAGKDLRHLLWSSIDNDDSLDLDQLTAAEALTGQRVRILVAVADVDALVKKDSAVDGHARLNTTSVYTAGKTFPMLPERLSTNLTSLSDHADRPALIIDMVLDKAGRLLSSDIYRALVRNHAKLAYNSVAAWLEGKGPEPPALAAVPGLADNLRLQDQAAQQLKARRHERGALDLQTLETHPVFTDDMIQDLQAEEKNRAKELIEDFMIAANGVTARFLHEKKVPSLRRVVRSPKRWDRIVDLAAQHEFQLPAEPDPRALAQFLAREKAADPVHFPDLSLSVIKLLGPGEYAVEFPEETAPGHFGLAVRDYTHSTAPNRRFADLLTHRTLKAALAGTPVPYSGDELADLARHCTQKEDDANKVERQVGKSAAAMLLSSRMGERFDAICTGAAAKGTWVRIFQPPIEGRLLHGYEGVDVGDRLQVQLVRTDVERGYIDFRQVP